MERNGECMRRVERGGRLMVSVTPTGFSVRDGSVLQGFRRRSTTCLWSCHPYGVLPLNLSVNRRLT